MIRINIYSKSKEIINLNHWLKLDDEYSNHEINILDKIKSVYLSYTDADTKFAKVLESKLTSLGMRVFSPSDIPAGVSIHDYIEKSINSSDALIEIVSETEDIWQKKEVEMANKAAVQTLSIKDFVKKTTSEIRNLKDSAEEILSDNQVKSIINRIKIIDNPFDRK